MSEEKRDAFDGGDAQPDRVSSLHGRWESLTCNDRAGSQENEVEPDGRDSPLGSGCSANEALDCQLDLHQIAVTPAIFIGADREDLQYE